MIFSLHTFKIKLNPNTKSFNKWKDGAYEAAKKGHPVFRDKENLNKHIDTALTKKGIDIIYHDDPYKKKIKLRVNPTKLLGGDDVIKLWKPNSDKSIGGNSQKL